MPFVIDGGGPVLSAWVAEACIRVSGRNWRGGRTSACGLRKRRKGGNWTQGISSKSFTCAHGRSDRGSGRHSLGAELGEVEGKKAIKARLVAGRYWGPNLRDGNLDIAGRVGRGSPHWRLISLSALKKWEIWSSDTKSAFCHTDGFDREVFVRDARE